MDFSWIDNFIPRQDMSISHTIELLCFVIAAGTALGKIKFGQISLGVTFVLFAGLIMGQLGFAPDSEVLVFCREFGLILFIFALGLQVGPSFFSSFRKMGVKLNLLALFAIILNIGVMLGLYYWYKGGASIFALVGVLSGAVTNTPSLAAAQQAATSQEAVNLLSVTYAVTYPVGFICGILMIMWLKRLLHINVEREIKDINDHDDAVINAPCYTTFRVTNSDIHGKSVLELHEIAKFKFIISRIKSGKSAAYAPKGDSIVREGDLLIIVFPAKEMERLRKFIGPEVKMDWDSEPSLSSAKLVSRNILITNRKYDGATLRSLKLHSQFRLNTTRVTRAGGILLATPELRLQMGDRVTVVGLLDDINMLANRLGNSVKHLDQPNIITIFIGIMLGVWLGHINFGYGIKLGIAGGPLIVAILLSRFGYKFKLVTYVSSSASLMLRELGMALYLASVGLDAGPQFFASVCDMQGMWWIAWGLAIAVIPLLIVAGVARFLFKLNFLTIAGLLSGVYANPPALAYANDSMGSDAPSVAYLTVYPLSMCLRVVVAQLLIMSLA